MASIKLTPGEVEKLGKVGPTPGPWRIEQVEKWPFTLTIRGKDDEWPIMQDDPFTYSTSDRHKDQVNCLEGNQRWLANARLIAAAPDLLEALKNVLLYAEDEPNPFGHDCEWCCRCTDKIRLHARQAVAKAESK